MFIEFRPEARRYRGPAYDVIPQREFELLPVVPQLNSTG
jgi:hypothetical protein